MAISLAGCAPGATAARSGACTGASACTTCMTAKRNTKATTNSTHAEARGIHAELITSVAISGVAAMRPIVIAFGRFITRVRTSAKRLQNQFRDCLQGIEYTFARHRHRFEMCRPLDPLSRRKL